MDQSIEDSMISDYQSDMKLTEIFAKYNINSRIFYKILYSRGVKLKSPKSNVRKKDADVIVDYINQDLTVQEIYKKYNIDDGKLYHILDRNRITYRRFRPMVNGERTTRDIWLFKSKGISENQYEDLLKEQNGVCAICNKPNDSLNSNGEQHKHLCVDHNHDSGVVRGLLCSSCNCGLGFFKDSPNHLAMALVYLLNRGYYSN